MKAGGGNESGRGDAVVLGDESGRGAMDGAGAR